MDKQEIVKELNEWAKKELGSEFKVDIDCDDLTLFRENDYIAWFAYFHKYHFKFNSSGDGNVNVELIKNHIIEKFHNKAFELLSKHEPKYTVQVFPQERGYLNVIHDFEPSKDVAYDIGWPEDRSSLTRTEFTQSEIEELKKRDIAIDWDKAVIKEVDDNE